MLQAELKWKAQCLGYQDAKQGRVYRHSADPGSWVMNWLGEYEKGWRQYQLYGMQIRNEPPAS